ncbi:helix-turn-helix transcriptional regulator [Hassallia byssoidea VB512170]|uniref:Helix-turn-helix transcriptional regulator n=1 Tax=Hassallia byssoidea VB512170 TaxID=1304833 RepID=A0A846HHG1_9CYAN|nr:helix-turn-helix transcriptional regulator [Hassalia byssoidea]NEU76957.1 helix-turn-helix transcriptional regulator [Hassalia byssoidea VB512170]
MYYELTPKEFETLTLVGQGKSNKEIAEIQVVSIRTIESHVSSILRETGCVSRNKLIILFLNSKDKFIPRAYKRTSTIEKQITQLFIERSGILPSSTAVAITGASRGYASNIIQKLRRIKNSQVLCK